MGPTRDNRDTAPAALPPLWRNRDFMILWTSETVSQLGSSMSFFVFPLIGYTVTGSTTQAALSGSAFALGMVASRLPAGALVDRWNRRAVLLGSNLSGAVLYASVAVALMVGHLSIVHLVAVALLTGVAASFFGPAETAAIRCVVPTQQLPTAFSQNQARQYVASLVGPPLGGLLYAVSRAIPFVVDAVTYAAASVATARIRTPLPAPERPDTPPRMRTDIAEGLRFLWSRGFLRGIVMYAALINFATNWLFLVLTLKLLQAGVHPVAIGSIETVSAVAGIVGSIIAPALIRRLPTGLLTITSGLVAALACAPMALTNNVIIIGALLGGAIFLLPAGNASVSSYLVAFTPDNLQGRTQSALRFAGGSLMPFGAVVGGGMLARFGAETAMLTAAVLVGVSVLPLLLNADVRSLPRPDRWDVAAA